MCTSMQSRFVDPPGHRNEAPRAVNLKFNRDLYLAARYLERKCNSTNFSKLKNSGWVKILQ